MTARAVDFFARDAVSAGFALRVADRTDDCLKLVAAEFRRAVRPESLRIESVAPVRGNYFERIFIRAKLDEFRCFV